MSKNLKLHAQYNGIYAVDKSLAYNFQSYNLASLHLCLKLQYTLKFAAS